MSLHSHDVQLTPEWSLSFRRTFSQIDRPQPVLHKRFKGKVTLSHSHSFELANRWIGSQHLARLHRPPPDRPPPSTPPISLDHSLPQAHLQTRSITVSECISKFTRSWPSSSSPNWLDHGLGVYLWIHSILASKYNSELARSLPPSASLSTLDFGLKVHLQPRSFMASQCISEFTQFRSPIASPNSLDHGLGLYLWVHLIVIFRRTSNCCQAPPAEPVQIYRV